ncbi:DNA-3-methyladenine glycosylase I [Mycobacteroides salmoniphilum]|uniref:DNA-3-methyladenine glycosylase 1 n=1 Tax=Mycobacteroides salmoniphilum TaxID=404941 RepID=A0A4R8ST69_9MYCO|nr:DNA-3-methyladenine glycosylase I [Mycobacteroides salmoniphilum]TDZ94074.1 DNA-3-methyladenine glycosylase 1 [Mycobacteroides salmoniphilum]TEA03539.1 DNA-3-methyladenine glycosylase 1 [Mycobacteroides salmoniphilum]
MPTKAPSRCSWAVDPAGSTLYADYHDNEWGRPLYGRDALFERLCLEAFQSGLAWITILRKREGFRRAFEGFIPEQIARYGDKDVARLMADAEIVRNRAKIESSISNARAVLDLDTDLSDLLWSFAPKRRARPQRLSDVPAVTDESTAMAKELKRRGFRFVGPTTAYALMQATGMVDDHVRSCWVPRVDTAPSGRPS